MEKEIYYSWTIFDNEGHYTSSGSPMGKVTLDKAKDYVKSACWREGYTGLLVGVCVTGVAVSWLYVKGVME